MLRFLFWVIIVSWSVSLLRRLVNRMGRGARNGQEPIDVPSDARSQKLVRDPVCGMHLAEGLALAERSSSGEPVFFCSEECRNKFPVGTATPATISGYDVVLPQHTTLSNRTSFVIAPDGKIIYVLSEMSPEGHVQGTLGAVKASRALQRALHRVRA